MVEERKGRFPDFKGNIEMSAWINKMKSGEQYISIDFSNSKKVLFNIKLWPNKPREQSRRPSDSEKGHSKAFYPEQYGDF